MHHVLHGGPMKRIILLGIDVLAVSLMGLSVEAQAQGAPGGAGQSGKPPSGPSVQQRIGEVDKCIKDTGQAFGGLLDVIHGLPAILGTPRSSQGCVGNASRCLTDRQQKIDIFTKESLRDFLGTDVILPGPPGSSAECVAFKNNVRAAFLPMLLRELNDLRAKYNLPPLPDPRNSPSGQR